MPHSRLFDFEGERGGNGTGANDPVNGPMLFEWARSAFGPGSHVPQGTPDLEIACGIMRESLK